MPRKSKSPLADMTVKAEDCFDPADYYMIHRNYFEGLLTAVREAHKRINDEWGGDTANCVCVYCSRPLPSAEGKSGDGK